MSVLEKVTDKFSYWALMAPVAALVGDAIAGSVPGDIPGIVEIGVLVPTNLRAAAAAPVTLTIGGVTTIQNATLAVQ